jgi:predicted secreted protein
MIQKFKCVLIAAVLLIGATGYTAANDVASFTNLGFSADSRVFMFAQYGINVESGYPFAEIYTVDVAANSFVSGGVTRQTYPIRVSPGQDGIGALYTLLPTVKPLVDRYNLSHVAQGRLIYLFVNGQEPRSQIEFRDFESGNRYSIVLHQDSAGGGTSGRAAFYLDVTLTRSDGRRFEHRVGRPGYFRDGFNRYRISQAILGPDDRSLVVVIEKITDIDGGQRIRYMVETVRLY